jgi:hypothetical protein
MDAKDVNSEEFIEELISCGEFPFKLNAYQAYICVCLFQLALKHPDLKPEDATYKTGKAVAQCLHANLAERSALIGEVLEEGWDEYFMLDIQLDEETSTAGNFSGLNPAKKYRLALLHQALMMATSWLDEVTDQSMEEVTDTVFKLAEENLASNDYEVIPKVIKNLDEDEFLK